MLVHDAKPPVLAATIALRCAETRSKLCPVFTDLASDLYFAELMPPNGLPVGPKPVIDQHARCVDARSTVDLMVNAKRVRLEGLDVGIVVEQDEEVPLTKSLEEV
jgi:hypothetical protein